MTGNKEIRVKGILHCGYNRAPATIYVLAHLQNRFGAWNTLTFTRLQTAIDSGKLVQQVIIKPHLVNLSMVTVRFPYTAENLHFIKSLTKIKNRLLNKI